MPYSVTIQATQCGFTEDQTLRRTIPNAPRAEIIKQALRLAAWEGPYRTEDHGDMIRIYYPSAPEQLLVDMIYD